MELPLIVLLVVFVCLVLVGVPIGFTLMLSSMAYILMSGTPVSIVMQKFASGVNSFTLIAVPFFILAANFMNTSGITSRLFNWT